jgi:hypothetical protein
MSNTIVRAPRRHRFVIIDQRAIEDTRLSWAAQQPKPSPPNNAILTAKRGSPSAGNWGMSASRSRQLI